MGHYGILLLNVEFLEQSVMELSLLQLPEFLSVLREWPRV